MRYAPNSLALLYRAENTGNPAHDISEHLAKFPAHRIDLQETQLVGGRVIGRVQQALGPADDDELQHKILTIPYAEDRLGSNADAVEFVRVIKECVGADPDPRSLQIWASHAYDQIERLLREYDQSSQLSREDHRQTVITKVLTDLGRTAMELTAITATTEEHLLAEPEVYEFYGQEHCYTDGDDDNERRNLFALRCKELLDKQDISDPFTAELHHIAAKLGPAGSFSNHQSDSSAYRTYLRDDCNVKDEDELESIVDEFERATEQYTENGATSLHMSDGERFIVDGTIDEDVDETYLPVDLVEIVTDIRELFIQGTPLSSEDKDVFTIQRFIDNQLDILYGSRGDETARTFRTISVTVSLPANLKAGLPEIERELSSGIPLYAVQKSIDTRIRALFDDDRQVLQYCQLLRNMLPAIRRGAYSIDNAGLVSYQRTTSTYRNADIRRYVEEVLAQIIQNIARDFVIASQRRSPLFRKLFIAISESTDSRELKQVIRQAYDARKTHRLNIKMFTALNTLYQARCALLESSPLKQQEGQSTRMVALPWLRLVESIPAPQLRTLATGIHSLPLQEKERVRAFLSARRPAMYARIKTGLAEIVRTASARKLSYLRFAFFEESTTGAPNEPNNMFHLLSKNDRAEIWELLKTRSRLPMPVAA